MPPDVVGAVGVVGGVAAGAEEVGAAFSAVAAGSFFAPLVDSDDSPVGGFILSE